MAIQLSTRAAILEVLPAQYGQQSNQANQAAQEALAQKPSFKGPIITMVGGAFIALAALFMILAANQVLPHDVNAFSEMGVGGQSIAYGAMGLGVIVIILGAVNYHISTKKVTMIDGILSTTSEIHRKEIYTFVARTIGKNEILVVDDPDRKKICIYQDISEKGIVSSMRDITMDYQDNGQAKFNQWAQNQDLSKFHFVTPQELKDRA